MNRQRLGNSLLGLMVTLSMLLGVNAALAATATVNAKSKTTVVKKKVVVQAAPALSDAQLDERINKKLHSLITTVSVVDLQPEVFNAIAAALKDDPTLTEPTLEGVAALSEALAETVGDDDFADLQRGHNKRMSKDEFLGQNSSFAGSVASLVQDLVDKHNRSLRAGLTTPAGSLLNDRLDKMQDVFTALRGGADDQSFSDPRGLASSGPRRAEGHAARDAESRRNKGIVGGESQTREGKIGRKNFYRTTETHTPTSDLKGDVTHIFTTTSDADGNVLSESSTVKTSDNQGNTLSLTTTTTHYNSDGSIKSTEVNDGTNSGTHKCEGADCKDEVTGGTGKDKSGGTVIVRDDGGRKERQEDDERRRREEQRAERERGGYQPLDGGYYHDRHDNDDTDDTNDTNETGHSSSDDGNVPTSYSHCPQDNCSADSPFVRHAMAVFQTLAALHGTGQRDTRIGAVMGILERCDRNGQSCESPTIVLNSNAVNLAAARLHADDSDPCDNRRDDVCGQEEGRRAFVPLCFSSDTCGGVGIVDMSEVDEDAARELLSEGVAASLSSSGFGLDIVVEFAGSRAIKAHVVGNLHRVLNVPKNL